MFIFACNNENDFSNNDKAITKANDNAITESEGKDENFALKETFAKAFAKVLYESKEARDMIKEESLKQIDYDFDVLYNIIKDKPLSDGNTIEKLLSKYISKNEQDVISKQIPTLTIFVPTLPENSFSAALWNTNTEIPVVAVRTSKTNDVPVYNEKGEESILESNLIPGYPIVVIKENERIGTSKTMTKAQNDDNFSSKDGINYFFLSEVFDNTKNKQKMTKAITIAPEENIQKLFDAYDIYPNATGWQRDYIYYNITPSSPKGPFQNNFKEHIVSFELLGNAENALGKISDQTGDPTIDKAWHLHHYNNYTVASGWTDGEFEFEVKVYCGSKSAVGNEFTTNFRAKPDNLFTVTLKKTYSEDKAHFNYDKIYAKKMRLSLPLFEWDLENYSPSMKISISEYDASQTDQKTVTTSNEFASNFSFDAGWGAVVKIGAKYGASSKSTLTQSYVETTTLGSDQLGDVVINFFDPVLLSKNNTHITTTGGRSDQYFDPDYNNTYITGFYRIQIAPKKIY